MTNYLPVGATRPAESTWMQRPAGFRSYERTVVLGKGDALWREASEALLSWGVKTRSGFEIEPPGEVRAGTDYQLRARIGCLSVNEPARVVAVVDQPDRRGFAYGTRSGHPVRGEEAFILHRSTDGSVRLTVRSLTAAPRGAWLLAYPVTLIAQRCYRRRYLRALL